MLNFKTVYQLLDTFKDNADCLAYYEDIRFADGVYCPHCNGSKHYKLKKAYQYRCGNKDCRKSFNVLTKTVFENTKVPLRIWFAAMYLLTTGKKGISSLQLANQLGITQKTAWFLLHRIREMLIDKEPKFLEGVVQVDETNITGKDINRHESKKKSYSVQAKTFESKTMVGAISNDGKVITKHVVDRKKEIFKTFCT